MAAALKHGARLRTRLPFLGVTRCCPHGSLTRSAVRTFTAADSSSVARVRPHTAPTHDASAGSHRPGRSAYAESWGFACHAQVRRCHAERAHSGGAADAAAATTEPVDSPTAGFKDGTLVEVRWREIRQRAWPDTERRLETGGWEHPAVPRSLAELRALIPHVRNDIPALQHAVSKLKQQGKGRFLPTVQVHGLLRVACDCLDDGQDPHDVSEMLGTLSAAIGGDYPAGQDGNPQSAYIDTVLSVLFYTASKGPAGLDSVHLFVRDLLRRSNRVPVSIVETACALLASDPSGRADSGPGRMEQLYSLYRLHGKPRRGDKKAAADSAKLHALLTFVRSLDPYRAAIASQLRDMARGVPVPEPSQDISVSLEHFLPRDMVGVIQDIEAFRHMSLPSWVDCCQPAFKEHYVATAEALSRQKGDRLAQLVDTFVSGVGVKAFQRSLLARIQGVAWLVLAAGREDLVLKMVRGVLPEKGKRFTLLERDRAHVIMAVAVAFEQLDTACTIHDQIRSHGNAPISTDLMIKAACVHERVDLLCRALQWADAATFAERHLRRLRMQLLWSNNPLNDDQLSHTNMSQPWWGLLTTPLLNDTVEELLDQDFTTIAERLVSAAGLAGLTPHMGLVADIYGGSSRLIDHDDGTSREGDARVLYHPLRSGVRAAFDVVERRANCPARLPLDPLLPDTSVFGDDTVPGAAGSLDPDDTIAAEWWGTYEEALAQGTAPHYEVGHGFAPPTEQVVLPGAGVLEELVGNLPSVVAAADATAPPPRSPPVPLLVGAGNVDELLDTLTNEHLRRRAEELGLPPSRVVVDNSAFKLAMRRQRRKTARKVSTLKR